MGFKLDFHMQVMPDIMLSSTLLDNDWHICEKENKYSNKEGNGQLKS